MKPIPEMTDPEMDEAMAVEVMGGGDNYTTIYAIEHYKQWNPTFDLNQAWECAEKWKNIDRFNRRVEIIGMATEWECSLYTFSAKEYWTLLCDAYNTSPACAICEALLMAARSERR